MIANVTQNLYRIHDVTRRLGVSRATVYRMVQKGKLRLVKISDRASGITVESLEALVNESKAELPGTFRADPTKLSSGS